MTRIAVIVSTYNRPDALQAVLRGYRAQRDRGFELVVADDGSTGDTRDVVDRARCTVSFPIQHVWHPDEGFRLAAIRNRAVAATNADYLIFTDGDCVPNRAFVATHRKLIRRRRLVSGSRILLGERFTADVLQDRIPIHDWTFPDWCRAHWRGNVNRVSALLELPRLLPLGRLWGRTWKGARGCNIAAWRSDVENVNGFDERYAGWGLEDSDFVIRLVNAGVRHYRARFGTPVFHLWHRENDQTHLEANRRYLEELQASRRTRAEHGLDRQPRKAA